jgi:hypothetical protein
MNQMQHRQPTVKSHAAAEEQHAAAGEEKSRNNFSASQTSKQQRP